MKFFWKKVLTKSVKGGIITKLSHESSAKQEKKVEFKPVCGGLTVLTAHVPLEWKTWNLPKVLKKL